MNHLPPYISFNFQTADTLCTLSCCRLSPSLTPLFSLFETLIVRVWITYALPYLTFTVISRDCGYLLRDCGYSSSSTADTTVALSFLTVISRDCGYSIYIIARDCGYSSSSTTFVPTFSHTFPSNFRTADTLLFQNPPFYTTPMECQMWLRNYFPRLRTRGKTHF